MHTHHEKHNTHKSGWLRAAVMGANDGIVSTASLVIGVAAAGSSINEILIAGTAGLAAGAMSMGAGEYVSVSSQADLEAADLEQEKQALEENREEETIELSHIYIDRGLEPKLALQVAEALMEHDALGAHARDEIGITDLTRAQPVLAAVSSATTFAVGAFLPLLVVLVSKSADLILTVALSSLLFLFLLGVLSAHAGGASKLKGALRIVLWSSVAMLITFFVGSGIEQIF